MEMAKGVDMARGGKAVHPGPLFGEVTGVPLVFLRPGKVYRGMGNVVVAAENKMAPPFGQGVAELEHDAAKSEFVIKPGARVLGIGEVCGYQNKILKFSLEYPPLVVKFGYAQRINIQGLYFCINGNPGIPLLFGACPVRLIGLSLFITGAGKFRGKLAGMGLGFVQAEYIGGFPFKPPEKTFLFHSPNTIDIPGKHSH
jgi:hypothetical protein